MFNNIFSSKILENIVEPERPQLTIWCMRIRMLDTRAYAYTRRICNMYWFSTATIVAPQCYVIRSLPVLLFRLFA